MDSENILLDKDQETIETWAYIEIMGHSKVAGRVSERKIGTAVMLQVDIPSAEEGEKGLSHSELYSPAAIFSIKPTTEEWCRRFVRARVNYPVLPYVPDGKKLIPEKVESGNSDDGFDKFLDEMDEDDRL